MYRHCEAYLDRFSSKHGLSDFRNQARLVTTNIVLPMHYQVRRKSTKLVHIRTTCHYQAQNSANKQQSIGRAILVVLPFNQRQFCPLQQQDQVLYKTSNDIK